MRANTKKHEMGKRFAIVIGVVAAGVMALGAQTGAQTQAPTPRGQAPPTCKGLAATIVGTVGDDRLDRPLTTNGRDVIVGLGGDDIIIGRRGNDLICGGKGGDALVGDKGNDTQLGQAGGDEFLDGPGYDRCLGGKGRDITGTTDRTPAHKWVCEVEKSIERSGVQVH